MLYRVERTWSFMWASLPDLKSRLIEHNRGFNSSTKRYVPWKLIYYEARISKSDAKRREKYFKTTQGRRLLKRRIKDYLYESKKS